MISLKKYKGYLGIPTHVDDDTGRLHGEVVGLKGELTFEGMTVKELEQDFHATVDCYIAACKERGEKPAKAYSGRVNLRLNPELHEKLSYMAAQKKISLNQLLNEKLAEGSKQKENTCVQ